MNDDAERTPWLPYYKIPKRPGYYETRRGPRGRVIRRYGNIYGVWFDPHPTMPGKGSRVSTFAHIGKDVVKHQWRGITKEAYLKLRVNQ